MYFPDDWDVSTVLPIFSVGAVTLGFTAFFLGQFIDRVGPRAIATAVAGIFFSVQDGCFDFLLILAQHFATQDKYCHHIFS